MDILWILFAFACGFGIKQIGLPPLIGVWSKWQIGVGAAATDPWVVAVLMISSLLNVAYLMPIIGRGFFRPLPDVPDGDPVVRKEAPLACLFAISITAGLCFGLFFAANEIQALLQPIVDVPVTGGGDAN